MRPAPRSPKQRTEWTRRQFVATTFAAAVALAFARRVARAEAVAPRPSRSEPLGATSPVKLRVNGRDLTLDLEPRVTLLDALREYAGITGTKKGCDHGQCGACTVHVDGRRVLSCLTLAVMQQGKEITTIEGLARAGRRAPPVQQAFIDARRLSVRLLHVRARSCRRSRWSASHGAPTDDDVREAMSGNICRCGAYPGIVAAIQEVRKAPHDQGGRHEAVRLHGAGTLDEAARAGASAPARDSSPAARRSSTS